MVSKQSAFLPALAAFKYAKFGYLGHTYDGMYDMNTDPTAFAATFDWAVCFSAGCAVVAAFGSTSVTLSGSCGVSAPPAPRSYP